MLLAGQLVDPCNRVKIKLLLLFNYFEQVTNPDQLGLKKNLKTKSFYDS